MIDTNATLAQGTAVMFRNFMESSRCDHLHPYGGSGRFSGVLSEFIGKRISITP